MMNIETKAVYKVMFLEQSGCKETMLRNVALYTRIETV